MEVHLFVTYQVWVRPTFMSYSTGTIARQVNLKRVWCNVYAIHHVHNF